MGLLAEFECGCVGFKEPNEDGRTRMVYLCDTLDDPYGIGTTRDMRDKVQRPITPKEEELIFTKLSELILNGYTMREHRRFLKAIMGE